MSNKLTTDTILVTKDYDMFKFLPFNRPIGKTYLDKLKRNIQKKNLLHVNEIKVTKDYYVIDGQNRLAAARDLGLPIYYRIVDIDSDDVEAVQMIQLTKRWTTQEHLRALALKGDEIARHMLLIKPEMPHINWEIICSILLGTRKPLTMFNRGKRCEELIHKDDFKENLKRLYELVDVMNYLKTQTTVPLHFRKSQKLMYAIMYMLTCPKVKATMLQKKIGMMSQRLLSRRSVLEFVKDLIYIYNYRLSDENQITLDMIPDNELISRTSHKGLE